MGGKPGGSCNMGDFEVLQDPCSCEFPVEVRMMVCLSLKGWREYDSNCLQAIQRMALRHLKADAEGWLHGAVSAHFCEMRFKHLQPRARFDLAREGGLARREGGVATALLMV